MILVLLTRFCDSEDSGYKICQILVKQGHDLFVTSVSTGKALEAETKNAKELSMREKGSVTILNSDNEDPQPDWITKYHKKYFSYLSWLDSVNVIIGTLPGTEQTAVELAGILKSRLILLASTQIPNSGNEELKKMAEQVDEFWSVGTDVYKHNDAVFENISSVSSGKHREIILRPLNLVSKLILGLSSEKTSEQILVVLPRFSGSPESVLGYQLCLQLVQQGLKLCVTTTSTGKCFEAETKTAEELTTKFPGSISIMQIDLDQPELPSQSYENNNFAVIVGLLPVTTKMALKLKQALNCKLVLLATSKLSVCSQEVSDDLSELTKESDEIWSVGPDMYMYYQSLIQNERIHRKILLQPTTKGSRYWELNTRMSNNTTMRFISVWKNCQYINKGRQFKLTESSVQNFSTVCSALGTLSKNENYKGNIQWNVHGLENREPTANVIRDTAQTDEIELNAVNAINSIEEIPWKSSQAFIVPDIVDNSLNFIALTAIWLGIPTIVSSQTALGKFLLELDCPSKTRAVVILSGDPAADRKVWIDKIHKEILDEHALPMRWARELSEYLQNSPHLWEMDLSIFTAGYPVRERRLSADTTMPYTAAYEKQPCPEVLSKVGPWLQATEEAKHDQVLI